MKRILNYIFLVLLFAVVAVSLNNIIDDARKTQVEVYFVQLDKKDRQVVKPVLRKVSKDSLIEQTLKQLLQGPSIKETAQGFSSEIPSSTKCLGVIESEKEVILNLSEDFELGGGTGSMSVRLEQLLNTVLGLVAKPVFLQIEGEQVEALGGEGIFIEQPLKREHIRD